MRRARPQITSPTARQLRNFIAIVELKSLTKAAVLVGVVPSALSAQLSALEKELNCELVRRDGRGVHPTEHGLLLLAEAKGILRLIGGLEASVRDVGKAVGGEISVGMLPTLASSFAVPLLDVMGEQYPLVRLKIFEAPSGDLSAMFSSGELDLSTLYKHQNRPDYLSTTLLTEELHLIGLKSNAIFATTTVSFHEAIRLPLVLPTANHGLRFLLEGAAADHGLRLKVFAEVNSLSVTKALLLRPSIFAIMPWRAFEGVDGGIASVPIEKPALEREIILAQSTEYRKVAAVSAVVKSLTRLVPSKVDVR
jgi:DNA-binding transcriptional LysR family regulator